MPIRKCDICNYATSVPTNWNNHLKTKKHAKNVELNNLKIIENEQGVKHIKPCKSKVTAYNKELAELKRKHQELEAKNKELEKEKIDRLANEVKLLRKKCDDYDEYIKYVASEAWNLAKQQSTQQMTLLTHLNKKFDGCDNVTNIDDLNDIIDD